MCWIYVPPGSFPSAPGSEDSTLASRWRSQLLESSAVLNGKPSPATSWLRAWKRVPWIRPLFGRIFDPSTAKRGVDASMASLAVSPARPSPKPGKGKEPTTSDGFGLNSPDFFARRARGGDFLRTSGGYYQSTLDGSSDQFSETWMTSGSMRSGSLFRRETWVPATEESESSSWLTPAGMTGTDHTGKAGSGGELHMQTQSWPSPKVQDLRHASMSPAERDRHSPTLGAFAHTFPTPTAKDADGSRDTSSRPGSRRHKGKTLTDATMDLWPATPAERTEPSSRTTDLSSAPSAEGDWPTPNVPNGGRTMSAEDIASKGATARGKRQVGLENVAEIWPTPRTITGGAESAERKKELGREEAGGGDLQAAADLWQTPAVCSPQSMRGAGQDPEKRRAQGHQVNLQDQAGAWPTPRAEDSESCGNHPGAKDSLTGTTKDWKTPNTRDHHAQGPRLNHPQRQETLVDQASVWPTPVTNPEAPNASSNQVASPASLGEAAESWPTPAARDHKDPNSAKHVTETGTGKKHMDQLANFAEHGSPSSLRVPVISAHGGELSPTDLSTASRRRLNPAFVCWLMGWPWWWTNPAVISSAREATESYLSRLRSLLRSLLGERA